MVFLPGRRGRLYILKMKDAKNRPFRSWLARRMTPVAPVNTIVVPSPTVVFEPPAVVVPPANVVVRSDQPLTIICATWIMALASIAMLFVACATLIVSKDQWRAMEKQNNQTDTVLEQMRLEQRAWVSIRHPRLSEPELGKPLQWRMDLGNGGQTPALVERIEFNLARRHRDVVFDPTTVPLSATMLLQQSLAPDTEPTGIPFVITNNIVSQEMLDFIKDANATDRIYVFGRVYYDDVAGKERETEFSLVNEPGSLELRFHHKHNRMR